MESVGVWHIRVAEHALPFDEILLQHTSLEAKLATCDNMKEIIQLGISFDQIIKDENPRQNTVLVPEK